MTLQQISKIKSEFEGLKLNTFLTRMFTNKDWACTFEIKFMDENEMDKFIAYAKFNRLIWFIYRAGIHIQ